MLKTKVIPVGAFNLYDSLGVTIDNWKTIADIPFSHRYGSRLGVLVFKMFQGTQEESLENLLLKRNVDDFCFRKIVFAILCSVCPAKYLSLIRSRRMLDSPEAGYSDIVSPDLPVISRKRRYSSDDSYNTGDSRNDGESDSGIEDPYEDSTNKRNDDSGPKTSTPRGSSEFQNADPEFVAHLGIGCHLQENQPGSSAEERSSGSKELSLCSQCSSHEGGQLPKTLLECFNTISNIARARLSMLLSSQSSMSFS